MTFCHQCGARLSNNARFCPVCGATVSPAPQAGSTGQRQAAHPQQATRAQQQTGYPQQATRQQPAQAQRAAFQQQPTPQTAQAARQSQPGPYRQAAQPQTTAAYAATPSTPPQSTAAYAPATSPVPAPQTKRSHGGLKAFAAIAAFALVWCLALPAALGLTPGIAGPLPKLLAGTPLAAMVGPNISGSYLLTDSSGSSMKIDIKGDTITFSDPNDTSASFTGKLVQQSRQNGGTTYALNDWTLTGSRAPELLNELEQYNITGGDIQSFMNSFSPTITVPDGLGSGSYTGPWGMSASMLGLTFKLNATFNGNGSFDATASAPGASPASFGGSWYSDSSNTLTIFDAYDNPYWTLKRL